MLPTKFRNPRAGSDLIKSWAGGNRKEVMLMRFFDSLLLTGIGFLCLAYPACGLGSRTVSATQAGTFDQAASSVPRGHPLALCFGSSGDGWLLYPNSLLRLQNAAAANSTLISSVQENAPPGEKFRRLDMSSDGAVAFLTSEKAVSRTADGGRSWAKVIQPGSTETVNQVWVQGEAGWAIGAKLTTAFVDEPVLWRSSDGGSTWLQVDCLPILNRQRKGAGIRLDSIYFINERIGWITGTGVIWRTSDGGNTWDPSAIRIRDESAISLTKVEFFDSMSGFAICGPAKGAVPLQLVKTTDGGKSWQIVPTPLQVIRTGLSDYSFLTPDTGYALFQGQLYMTSDSCRKWNLVDLPNSVSADLVHFADEDHGWVVGQDGSLITTTNRGRTWENAYPPLATPR